MYKFMARVALSSSLVIPLIACSGETDAQDLQRASPAESGKVSAQAKEAADWTGLEDEATRAAIDKTLAARADDIGRFSFVVVDKFEEEDDWLAAGLAARETGGPAIVVSTDQKIIHFAGEEALAYFMDFRAKLAAETAAYFDRGEFVEGIDYATGQITECYQSDSTCPS